jgi:DUF4097 and DUF4098 domain-containing protein YvlB
MSAILPCARAVLATALAASLAGCVVRVDSDGYQEREEKRFTTKGRPAVHLATFDGSIIVRGWDRDEVSVEIQKRGRDKKAAQAIEVVSEQKGDAIKIEARRKDDGNDGMSFSWHHISRSARLVVSVPTGSDLVVRTGDGSIRVEHVTGKVELRSADGSVTGRDLSGDIVAHTEDGAIKLDGVDGKCDLASDDGSINVQGRFDGLRVSTEDGAVTVRAMPGSKVSRDWNLSTGDGALVLYVPDAVAAELDAQTRDGSVRLDSGLPFARDGRDGRDGRDEESRRTLRGRLGPGGPRLVLRTGDGSIRLRRQPGGPMPPPPPLPPPPPDTPVER